MVGGRKEIKLNRSVSSSLKIQYKSKRQRIARALLKKKTGELSPSCVKTSYCAGDSHMWVQGWTSRHLHTHTHTHTHTHKYQTDKCELVQPLWKTVWSMEVPQKPKVELPYDSAIPLLGTYPDKITIQKDTCTPVFIPALLTSQDMEEV